MIFNQDHKINLLQIKMILICKKKSFFCLIKCACKAAILFTKQLTSDFNSLSLKIDTNSRNENYSTLMLMSFLFFGCIWLVKDALAVNITQLRT